MSEIEIYDSYEELCENDAFECFQQHNVSHETVARILGYDVATDYMKWIRVNMK